MKASVNYATMKAMGKKKRNLRKLRRQHIRATLTCTGTHRDNRCALGIRARATLRRQGFELSFLKKQQRRVHIPCTIWRETEFLVEQRMSIYMGIYRAFTKEQKIGN